MKVPKYRLDPREVRRALDAHFRPFPKCDALEEVRDLIRRQIIRPVPWSDSKKPR